VKATFPDAKFDKGYVSTTRIDLNKGVYKTIQEDLSKNPLVRLVEFEGQILPYEQAKELKEKALEEEKKQRAQEREAAKKANEEKKAASKKITGPKEGAFGPSVNQKTGSVTPAKKNPKKVVEKHPE